MLKLHFFEQKFFFIKNDSLATENAILTPYQKLFSKKLQICRSDSENDGRNNEFLEREKNFLKMFLCTCRMQLWPRCPKLLVKILKTFCWSSGIVEKFIRFPKTLFVEMFVWTCTRKFSPACRNIVGKNTKIFSELQNCWSYIFLNKNVLFFENNSLARENAILTTPAKISF